MNAEVNDKPLTQVFHGAPPGHADRPGLPLLVHRPSLPEHREPPRSQLQVGSNRHGFVEATEVRDRPLSNQLEQAASVALYENDSNYWTVNCRPPFDQPEEDCVIYHASNLHNGDMNIHCDVCFNLQCGPACTDVWNECHDIFVQGHIYPCPENPTYGGDCQDLSEPHCKRPEVYYEEAAEKGQFHCPTANQEIVHVDSSCAYVCNSGKFGGVVTCVNRDGEGVYDESNFTPEMC